MKALYLACLPEVAHNGTTTSGSREAKLVEE